ncbi:MAG: cysteine hydrolase family protein [Anaerolineae bacterium]
MAAAYVTRETLADKTGAWLERLRPYNRHAMRLNPPACALLVVDMQTFFLDPASPTFTCGGQAVLPSIVRLMAAFRAAGRPVLYTRHVHHPSGNDLGIMGWWWAGSCIEGSPESEIHPDLAPLAQEKVIFKHRYSAFYNTDLEIVLRGLQVQDLVITGVMTNLCCESTARDAYFRDYRVFIPADGTGSIDEELHLASLMSLAFGFAWVTTAAELVREVEAQG